MLFFCGALWAICNQEGRSHVLRSAWLIFLILTTFSLSYWGEYGPLASPALGFPWGTLVEVGVGLAAYVGGALSGFATEELKEIVSAAGQELGSGPLPLLPSRLVSSRPSAS